MRFINKGNEPPIISNYKTFRQNAGQVVSYSDFPQANELNEMLRIEQRNICCYCMQSINHFQGEDEAGSHNEHLVPQNGANGNEELQMNYNNIYACCNYTRGFTFANSYCGWHKQDSLITNFIQQQNCRTFFKYNSSGEILPNGNFETVVQYLNEEKKLPQSQQHALEAIRVLNLNEPVLKKRRADLIAEIFPLISNYSTEQARATIQRMINLNTLPPFVEVNIYYLSLVRN